MTQATTTQIIQTPRQNNIIELLQQGKTHEEIAATLRISRATMERDIRAVLLDQNFVPWLKEEWLRRFRERIKMDPADREAFRALTMLLRRGGDVNFVHQ